MNDASVATIVACTVAGEAAAAIGPLTLAIPVVVAGASVSPVSSRSRFVNDPAETAIDWDAVWSAPVVAVSAAVKVKAPGRAGVTVKVDSPPTRVTRFSPPTLVGSVVCGSV